MSIIPAIEAKKLTYKREGEIILDDFSFRIPQGQLVGVIGPNGGGKTTLLKLMLGLIKPTSGTVAILDQDPRRSSVRKKVAYVAQRGGNIDPLFPATVKEVVQSGTTKRASKKTTKELTSLLDELDISHLLNRSLGTLSGGERQRTLIARALISKPEVLFLDEPTDGLDPESRQEFYDLLKQLKEKEKLTVVIVSHDVHTIAGIVDSALCLKHELVCHGEDECHLEGDELRHVFHQQPGDLEHHHSA